MWPSGIADNTTYGIVEYAANVTASYNNVWANTSGDIVSTYSQGTLTIIANISLDPQFIDPAFFLPAGSPCIDAGWLLPTDNDPDGTRNDMGVYGGPGARPTSGPNLPAARW